ncbi:hypothetical protein CS369_18540 [Candidatus Symbiopectobacterium sp. 'North America']|uniref:LysM peptidoglycan-binding domain-containing protein n=1 Tax=Candidatus Symbiopectobacterium sp. 'North America' TaxID=2794574 RepID=UPI0018CB599A|nr:LysM peptidoglycan-binding domain-containing protein [Candidatus Symbiopectobacterium sp. 'North America']MBG6246244.1 hypothetical protein [Candidatus Symbiopectobacterium sp. 'North America']
MLVRDFFCHLLQFLRVNPIYSQRAFLFMFALGGPIFSSYAQSTHQIFTDSEHLSSLPTTLYTLKIGESLQSVAKNLHVSMEVLRKLNESRSFLYEFDDLQPGEKLIIPALPLASSGTDYHLY